ncbi:MAG: MerR family transcriptional regulator [Deltaproteobacteria bacterium]
MKSRRRIQRKEGRIQIPHDAAVYTIGIVSKLLDIPEWTLRALEKEGLVSPERMNRKVRVYSLKQMRKIEHICYLMEEKRVNIGGVKVILQMEKVWEE